MNLTLERRTRGKRGRGSYGKTPAFGILQRNAKVYTEIAPDCSRATLQTIIRGKADSVIHSDKWREYNGLVDVGYPKHYRVDHRDNKFTVMCKDLWRFSPRMGKWQ